MSDRQVDARRTCLAAGCGGAIIPVFLVWLGLAFMIYGSTVGIPSANVVVKVEAGLITTVVMAAFQTIVLTLAGLTIPLIAVGLLLGRFAAGLSLRRRDDRDSPLVRVNLQVVNPAALVGRIGGIVLGGLGLVVVVSAIKPTGADFVPACFFAGGALTFTAVTLLFGWLGGLVFAGAASRERDNQAPLPETK